MQVRPWRSKTHKIQHMNNSTKRTLPEVLQAVERGITVTGTARILGVDPMTVRSYAKRWKSVADAIQAKRVELVDLSEMGLRGAVLKGEPWAITFALRTLGRETYGDRLQVEFLNSPEWIEMRTLIVNVLRPHPDALQALMEHLPVKDDK